MIQTLHIECKNAKWMVNGKTYSEMDMTERYLLSCFFRDMCISRASDSFISESPVIDPIIESIYRIDRNDPIFELPLSQVERDYGV